MTTSTTTDDAAGHVVHRRGEAAGRAARTGQWLRSARAGFARHPRVAFGALVLAALALAFWASRPTAEEAALAALEARWGVRPVGVRYSADGHVLDFRYRVVDPAKAGPLVDRRLAPYLTDEASGTRLAVPSTPKIGPLRQTTRYGQPKEGRTYFVLFANPGRLVKRGSKVTVVIGDFNAAHLVVS